jgi:hypothetical protein
VTHAIGHRRLRAKESRCIWREQAGGNEDSARAVARQSANGLACKCLSDRARVAARLDGEFAKLRCIESRAL